MGKAINPLLVEGQIIGGTAQALGYALLENAVVDDRGVMQNAQFTNYVIPTTLDTPTMDVTIVEEAYSKGPFGAKGVGELPMDVPAPAVAAAIYDATGLFMTELPILPERICQALHDLAQTLTARRRTFRGRRFKRLIDVLREDFELTGTKEGCGEGECGACSVFVDGELVNSCLIPVCQVDGARVETVEALGKPDALDPLQASFLTEGGAQCGICTPGMLMSAWAFIRDGGRDDPDAIREALAGNLCRCTGYQHIVSSVVATVRAAESARTRTKKK